MLLLPTSRRSYCCRSNEVTLSVSKVIVSGFCSCVFLGLPGPHFFFFGGTQSSLQLIGIFTVLLGNFSKKLSIVLLAISYAWTFLSNCASVSNFASKEDWCNYRSSAKINYFFGDA